MAGQNLGPPRSPPEIIDTEKAKNGKEQEIESQPSISKGGGKGGGHPPPDATN